MSRLRDQSLRRQVRIDEYSEQDGVGLAKLIARRDVSAHEVGKAALEAIAKVDPILNFTVQVFPERVEALGRIPPQGIMAGVPTLLKDFYKFEKGTVSECGCMLTRVLSDGTIVSWSCGCVVPACRSSVARACRSWDGPVPAAHGSMALREILAAGDLARRVFLGGSGRGSCGCSTDRTCLRRRGVNPITCGLSGTGRPEAVSGSRIGCARVVGSLCKHVRTSCGYPYSS